MSKRKRSSRGDQRRNAKLQRLRAMVPREHAILAVDLAENKQAFVITDHDSRVLGRKMLTCPVTEVGPALAWGRLVAAEAGFTGVTLACEPTGYRWKPLADLAAAAEITLVCVQPMLVGRGRIAEDYTPDKTDEKDAVVIARLASQLHVYVPEDQSPAWARLRHLGLRRSALLMAGSAARQQIRDLISCAWPAAIGAAAKPFDSITWLAAMSVTGCDPARVRRLGRTRLLAKITTGMAEWGGKRPCQRIVDNLLAAAAPEKSVISNRNHGALERAQLCLEEMSRVRAQREIVEDRMVAILDDLHLTSLVTSIPGLSAVGAAAILAETGDLARFTSARAVVKHAGLCPRANSSGTYAGTTTISGRGRPELRAAVWRAIIGILPNNEVYADRYRHLTTRSSNPLHPNQARIALGAALLRQLFMVVTTRTVWDPRLARGIVTAPSTTASASALMTAGVIDTAA